MTGLPEPLIRRERDDVTWFELACVYTDKKWKRVSAKHRASIADTLATVTPILVRSTRGMPDSAVLRRVLYGWAFNTAAREAGEPVAAEERDALAWIRRQSLKMPELREPVAMHRALTALSTRLDGKPAAAKTFKRKYPSFHQALKFGVELGYLVRDSVLDVTWEDDDAEEAVDRRRVVNPQQAEKLLATVGTIQRSGPKLVAFFGCIYYAGMRPSEVVRLRKASLELPADGGWGMAYLEKSGARVGRTWTDSGETRDDRGLKHRSTKTVRPVPLCPQLVDLLRHHVDTYGTTPDGRLFVGERGGALAESVYCRVWKLARTAALTVEQADSQLAARPYDLRHAAVSTWLNSGVSAQRVAEWAGHSVAVLLGIYAKRLDGNEDQARHRIERTLNGEPEDSPEEPPAT